MRPGSRRARRHTDIGRPQGCGPRALWAPVRRLRLRAAGTESDSMGEEALGVERLASPEHEVHGTGEFGRDDRQALALAMLGHQARAQRLCGLVGAQETHRGLRERPLQMRVADLLARVTEDLAAGLL